MPSVWSDPGYLVAVGMDSKGRNPQCLRDFGSRCSFDGVRAAEVDHRSSIFRKTPDGQLDCRFDDFDIPLLIGVNERRDLTLSRNVRNALRSIAAARRQRMTRSVIANRLSNAGSKASGK